MRIRKRFPPPSSSSLSSSSSSSPAAALFVSSDPQLNRPPVLLPHIQPNSHDENHLLVVQNNQPTKSDDPPPNQEMMIGSANPRWGFLTSIEKEKKIEEEGWKEEQEEKKSSNDTRKESIGAELNTSMHLSQTSSSYSSSTVVVVEWGEGDKIVLPLKKRKGSFESVILAGKEASSKVKEKMKSKTNKKSMLQNGHHEKEGIKETDQEEIIKHVNNGKNNSSTNVKKSKRGSVIMEGSRCSRVNGRGWRCCQQTLVGYSLCEHHLGKGRLRSMTSVRNRGMASRANHEQIGGRDDDQIAPLRLTLQENQEISEDFDDDDDVDDDQKKKKKKKPLVKKRMKLGVVKARSISSLLGQTNVDNRVVAAANIGGQKHGVEDEYYYHV